MTISRLWAFTTAKYKFSLTLTEGKLVVPPANLKFRITIKLQVARASLRATTYYRDRDWGIWSWLGLAGEVKLVSYQSRPRVDGMRGDLIEPRSQVTWISSTVDVCRSLSRDPIVKISVGPQQATCWGRSKGNSCTVKPGPNWNQKLRLCVLHYFFLTLVFVHLYLYIIVYSQFVVITAIYYNDRKKLLMLTFSLFSLINDCFFFSSRFRRPGFTIFGLPIISVFFNQIFTSPKVQTVWLVSSPKQYSCIRFFHPE